MGTPRVQAWGLAAFALLSIVSCAGPGTAASTTGANSVGTTATASAAPSGPAQIQITPGNNSQNVPLDSQLSVDAKGGVIRQVVVKENGAPTPLTGQTDATGQTWMVDGGLEPNAAYTLTATAANPNGQTTSTSTSFHTLGGVSRLITSILPADGAVVGVGMPIKLTFNVPIPDAQKQGIIDHIAVNSNPPQPGGWYWFTDSEVHYRPNVYWRSGTHVTINAMLQGVDAGNGYWGLGNWSQSFSIGDAHVSIIDTATHYMTVYDNGKQLYNWPVSTGRPDLQTINGTLVVWFKTYVILMNSWGIGINPNSPDGYDENVYWDTAISLDGFYVHSAPWSVWQQGNTNVSHGCVNLSEARAITFYNWSNTGDVVIVKNSTRPASFEDGEGDWQLSISQLIAGGGAAGQISTMPPTPYTRAS